MPPLPRKWSPGGASTECGGGHLIAARYSFITFTSLDFAQKSFLNGLLDIILVDTFLYQIFIFSAEQH